MTERPVRALKFQGFGLGIWMWPLINMILGRVGAARVTRESYSNLEEWTIKELPDGTVRMIIHRKAERG